MSDQKGCSSCYGCNNMIGHINQQGVSARDCTHHDGRNDRHGVQHRARDVPNSQSDRKDDRSIRNTREVVLLGPGTIHWEGHTAGKHHITKKEHAKTFCYADLACCGSLDSTRSGLGGMHNASDQESRYPCENLGYGIEDSIAYFLGVACHVLCWRSATAAHSQRHSWVEVCSGDVAQRADHGNHCCCCAPGLRAKVLFARQS
mmetsp:Transcript_71154/g.157046  ORF Transcript_71154/g.157046 Transcript_71154/m.157046 type:complete len:203 (+) Transcript_71154:86-694(+)